MCPSDGNRRVLTLLRGRPKRFVIYFLHSQVFLRSSIIIRAPDVPFLHPWYVARGGGGLGVERPIPISLNAIERIFASHDWCYIQMTTSSYRWWVDLWASLVKFSSTIASLVKNEITGMFSLEGPAQRRVLTKVAGRGGWGNLYCCGEQWQSVVTLVLQIKGEKEGSGLMFEG